MAGGFRWIFDTLTPGIAIFSLVMNEAVEHIAEDLAKEIQEYMQTNAPWNDRTGAAREGLAATVRDEGFHTYIDLYYNVDYGIWLEVKYNGQYAIILPTLERYGGETMQRMSSMFEVAR